MLRQTWFGFVNTTSIEFTCPSVILKRLVAEKLCEDSTYYHCLRVDNTNRYIQNCIDPEPLEKGKFPTFGDDNVTLYPEYCPAYRYQPQPMFTNERNECWYSKSTCTGEGQVVHTNRSGTQDRTCRCDYTKGFTFVTRPQAGCYCVPSEEDCSCYRKVCPDQQSLTQDYECADITTVTLYRCPGILCTTDKIVGKSSNLTKDKEKQEVHYPNYSVGKEILTMLIILLIFIWCLPVLYKVHVYIPCSIVCKESLKKAGSSQNIIHDLQNVTCVEGQEATFSCEVGNKHSEGTWYKDGIPILKSDNHKFCNMNGRCTLTIIKTSELYRGQYCVVMAGKSSRQAQLSFHETQSENEIYIYESLGKKENFKKENHIDHPKIDEKYQNLQSGTKNKNPKKLVPNGRK